jgi:hypothetical protein
MGEKVKLDIEPIDCPVCGEGQAAVYEEQREGAIVSCSTGSSETVAYSSRYRVCDHCETEFAGHDELEHNATQVNALHAEYGPVNFPL